MASEPNKIRWGVLSTAKIALTKVLPGMQKAANCEIVAIASRDLGRAQQAAKQLGIPTAYGSYEALLADPGIDAVYIPLPNDLHVPWAIRAAEAGKHVLCEKPIAMDVSETRRLMDVRDRTHRKIGEAFMVRLHPQWLRTRELIRQDRIGPLRLVQGEYSYFNIKPENIRNSVAAGGGALMDIGCYLIYLARFLFEAEPIRVLALIDRDPQMKIDRLTSMVLDFPDGQFIGTCGTQLVPHQRLQGFGTKGRIEVEIPVNAPPDRPARIFLDDGKDLSGAGITTETFPPVDQYTLQGQAFAAAILNNTEVPSTLEDALCNMAVIDALFRSALNSQWEKPTT